MARMGKASERSDEVQGLIAMGFYRSKSEAVREYLRTTSTQYEPRRSLAELRRDLDQKLADRPLSQAVREMREGELH